MQSCDIGGSLQSLQGRAGIHNRPTVLTMPPIHLMQNDVLDLTNRCRRRMKTPFRRSGRTMRHRNCNVKLDDLDWDRPDLGCEPQQSGASLAIFAWTRHGLDPVWWTHGQAACAV